MGFGVLFTTRGLEVTYFLASGHAYGNVLIPETTDPAHEADAKGPQAKGPRRKKIWVPHCYKSTRHALKKRQLFWHKKKRKKGGKWRRKSQTSFAP